MECHPAVGSKCGVGILHVCQVKKTITKNVPTIILTVHLRTWLISRKLSLCGLFWTTLYTPKLISVDGDGHCCHGPSSNWETLVKMFCGGADRIQNSPEVNG